MTAPPGLPADALPELPLRDRAVIAALMLLLFAVAVMDLRWVAVLSLVVAAEKLLPQPRLWRCAIGIAAIAIGIGFAAVAMGGR